MTDTKGEELMTRLQCKLTGVVTIILFIVGSIVFATESAWAKMPTYAEWKTQVKKYDIPKDKKMAKAFKKYEKAKNAAFTSKEARGSKKWAGKYKALGKAGISLDKVLEKHRANTKKKHGDKKEYLDFLKMMNKQLDKDIITFTGIASKYGKGEKSTTAIALKKYIKIFKKQAKSLKNNSDQGEICAVYRGPYRGIGTQLPEFKKHHKKYAKIADKFTKNATKVNKMCNAKGNFDAEKTIYTMKVTVEYLEKSLKNVLK